MRDEQIEQIEQYDKSVKLKNGEEVDVYYTVTWKTEGATYNHNCPEDRDSPDETELELDELEITKVISEEGDIYLSKKQEEEIKQELIDHAVERKVWGPVRGWKL